MITGGVQGDHVWASELTDYAEALAPLKPSGQFRVLGQPFLVPTRVDYAEAFERAGLLVGELADNADLVAVAQAHWHASGGNACVFAAHMSAIRDETGWQTVVLAPRANATEDAQALASLTYPRLMAPDVEVLSVIIPHADDSRYMAKLVHRLGQLPGWTLSEEGSEHDAQLGDLVRLGLRNDVEFGSIAEVLGFGPHGAYANTRRAPFTELAIRAKAPRKRRKDMRAFMAHVDIPELAKDEFSVWWEQTTANRRARLAPEQDDRGKARVTVALPAKDWEEETA